MVTQDSNAGGSPADLVFVVENTGNLAPYFQELKNAYVVPTLEHLHGSKIDELDCGYDCNSNMFGLVTFQSLDCTPEPVVSCLLSTAHPHKLLKAMDTIPFAGGTGDGSSYIAEGMATALHLFDDFTAFHEPNTKIRRYCVLVCNSLPYPMPSHDSSNYSDYLADQLASLMAEKGVHFSLVSPRKLTGLFRLYEAGAGVGEGQVSSSSSAVAAGKNYSTDLRHLVLLRGYQLREQQTSQLNEAKAAIADIKPTIVSSPGPANAGPGIGNKKGGGAPPGGRAGNVAVSGVTMGGGAAFKPLIVVPGSQQGASAEANSHSVAAMKDPR
ncbi:PREDICTED: mediator of RNA polymerase II transcription subunit 25-like [Priapulus caudatus]|uniref:Mediator of RNA polymerase II transcription subunit 25 n=1 Tax=Priapulus caudatus TaxID=37621 RepID=A0ABM1EV83_PRICU|nr:PREDICTED: mediator of RNA polymerase II transcription subunit 25-like [Priapulus caudatus]